MNAREIIENQQELIDLLREKIERLEDENKEAFGMVVKVCQTVLGDDFGSAPCIFAAEQAFRRMIDKQGLTTDYVFKDKYFSVPRWDREE